MGSSSSDPWRPGHAAAASFDEKGNIGYMTEGTSREEDSLFLLKVVATET